MKIRQIKIEEVQEPRLLPRFGLEGPELEELKASMAEIGLIQPIVVRPVDQGYRLVAGKRRLEAARQLGWPRISAVVQDVDDDTETAWTVAENLQRLDLNPVEEAAMMAQLLEERGWTHEQLGEIMGKSREWVTRRLALLDLDQATLAGVIQGRLSVAAALELRRLTDLPTRDYYRELAEKHGVTRAVLRDWVEERLSRVVPPEEWHGAGDEEWEPPPPERVLLHCAVCERDQDQVMLEVAWICRECAWRLEQAKAEEVPGG